MKKIAINKYTADSMMKLPPCLCALHKAGLF